MKPYYMKQIHYLSQSDISDNLCSHFLLELHSVVLQPTSWNLQLSWLFSTKTFKLKNLER